MTRNRTTLHDVAAQAGVSLTTAAAILRDAPGLRASRDTRDRVVQTAGQLQYRRNAVAASLQRGRTGLIGVLVPLEDASTHSYAQRSYPQELLIVVLQAATRAGLRLVPLPMPSCDADVRDLAHRITDRHIDGLILGAIYNVPLVNAIEMAGVPCVEISGTGRYVIRPDNEGGAASVVEHLAELGHTRIAHWHGGEGFAGQARSKGFLTAAQRLQVDSVIVWNHQGVRQQLEYPAELRPTALFAFNDYYACECLKIARDIGLCVPDDLSVVGFDGRILAETSYPPLTSVYNPIEAQAEAAVALLQARLGGEEPPESCLVLPTSLRIRGSTGSAPP